MKNILIKITVALLAIITLNACSSTNNIPTARNVDLKLYMGKWYEIARFETSFQRGKFDSLAEYVLLNNGTVLITNSATDKDGKRTYAKARGYAPNPKDSSRLRISFFRPFYGDYLILALDSDYKWSLVGSGGKEYLWILSRTPTLPQNTINNIIQIAQNLGYETSKLMFNYDIKRLAMSD